MPLAMTNSDAYEQSENLRIVTELPTYLITPSKKRDSVNFLRDVSEDNRESGSSCDSNDSADERMTIKNEMHMATMLKATCETNQESNKDIEVPD